MRAPVLWVAALMLVAVSGTLAGQGTCRDGSECADCDSKGLCLKCTQGYGMTPKRLKCVPCKVPGALGQFCTNCDFNAKYCKACFNWEYEGTGIYARNGRCERCLDPNCGICHDGSGKCKTCFRGMAISKKTGKCTNCADKNCVACDSSLKKCRTCYSGWAPNAAGTCVPCANANCDVCSTPAQCEYCKPGYVKVGRRCEKCLVANCDTCQPGKPNVCRMCVDYTPPVNGKCPQS
ncbi:hypothetical protein ABPG75_005020 [Micractinium tetrahymenae]